MARYDERGVVIPAPLQGSTFALAGKRYGNKHRGPAVLDAYELCHCWIDLANRSDRWPCPPNLPPLMVDLAQAVPQDQRADWLRRQANLEEVDRRISYAIRSGDLPIWVAPQGEPERLVATGALSTIDKRSICSGVFCPLSEEYKSDADRPWLWERPLFVKWDDWVRFVSRVRPAKEIELVAGGRKDQPPKYQAAFDAGADLNLVGFRQPPEQPAADDEWWSWPEAIAWVGSRDTGKVVSVRQAAAEWAKGGDQDVAIGAQFILVSRWGPDLQATSAAIQSEIERGIIGTMGRDNPESPCYRLLKEKWRGGEVVPGNGTADLVSAKRRTVFAYDVAVSRADLVAAFRPPRGDVPPPSSGAPNFTKPFSEAERLEWIKQTPMMNADAAFNRYKSNVRAGRIKREEFRAIWKAIKETKRGRPLDAQR